MKDVAMGGVVFFFGLRAHGQRFRSHGFESMLWGLRVAKGGRTAKEDSIVSSRRRHRKQKHATREYDPKGKYEQLNSPRFLLREFLRAPKEQDLRRVREIRIELLVVERVLKVQSRHPPCLAVLR